MNINDFISSIDNKIYNRIRQSKSDAECRRYLKEHLEAITVTHCCKSDSELLVCDKCYDTDGFYLGTTCPKCKQPFRSVKAN